MGGGLYSAFVGFVGWGLSAFLVFLNHCNQISLISGHLEKLIVCHPEFVNLLFLGIREKYEHVR